MPPFVAQPRPAAERWLSAGRLRSGLYGPRQGWGRHAGPRAKPPRPNLASIASKLLKVPSDLSLGLSCSRQKLAAKPRAPRDHRGSRECGVSPRPDAEKGAGPGVSKPLG